MKKLKVLSISDTHGNHQLLKRNWNQYDMIIHAGDASNNRDVGFNTNEMLSFLEWFESLPTKYKIFVPGNHDTSVERGNLIDWSKYPSVILLDHKSIEIEGINFFGSPYTPTFNNWAYNIKHHKISVYWNDIPTNTDILITHGPPKGILDLTINPDRSLELCGDKSLLNRVLTLNPLVHIFGHLHNCKGIKNAGIRRMSNKNTTFINASCVTDGIMGEISSDGIGFEIDRKTFIDPDSGWMFGFPKELPNDCTDISKFIIDSGYPKERFDDFPFYRMFTISDVKI